jgi:hypothetical protein
LSGELPSLCAKSTAAIVNLEVVHLQEKEFERLGGIRTIPIDVRLIAGERQ